ncbi:transposase [Magnetococcus sp. PR-3]|uniref:transposase n=1 Tax=Magnetococcus sp. PR-3 TaxID=3120355 RepID=UPI002FCE4410
MLPFFVEFNRQLEEKGLILKRGTLIDASLIQADRRPPPKKQDDEQAEPKDPGAKWTVKANKPHYGYKAHAAVDLDSKRIWGIELTSANVGDSIMYQRPDPR